VLLSAICVQKPLLEFQKAKLAFEAELQADGEMTHSIVRPTAFFKSLGGQVESCRKGGPYVMFGGGELASCKPISEADLARFMADCVHDQDRINQVLPIGGPGPALSAREQGEMLFRALGRTPRMLSLPIALMDAPIAVLQGLAKLVPSLQDTAEFGRIGRYYASESMLVWDEGTKRYDAEATPSYGEDTLEQFFERVVREGMAGQDLGDAALF
jgi:divinyl chlorophyllide a 8-vinyl-reductase